MPLKSVNGFASVINKTDTGVFTLFLILYSSSLTTFTLFCATLFKKSSQAATGSGIIYFVTYMPNIFISLRYEQFTIVDKILFGFVNNLAMSMGIQLVGIFEGLGTGINFSNFAEGISYEDSFSMAHVMVILIINNFFHLFLIYYFDNLLPGDHGIAKPWHFIFSCFYKQKPKEKILNKIELSAKDFFEDESIYSGRSIGIKIINLFKVFKQSNETKTAVENLNLNIYEGQITVLLGIFNFILIYD